MALVLAAVLAAVLVVQIRPQSVFVAAGNVLGVWGAAVQTGAGAVTISTFAGNVTLPDAFAIVHTPDQSAVVVVNSSAAWNGTLGIGPLVVSFEEGSWSVVPGVAAVVGQGEIVARAGDVTLVRVNMSGSPLDGWVVAIAAMHNSSFVTGVVYPMEPIQQGQGYTVYVVSDWPNGTDFAALCDYLVNQTRAVRSDGAYIYVSAGLLRQAVESGAAVDVDTIGQCSPPGQVFGSFTVWPAPPIAVADVVNGSATLAYPGDLVAASPIALVGYVAWVGLESPQAINASVDVTVQPG